MVKLLLLSYRHRKAPTVSEILLLRPATLNAIYPERSQSPHRVNQLFTFTDLTYSKHVSLLHGVRLSASLVALCAP